MEWKYVKKIKDINSVEKVEMRYAVSLPIFLKETILRYNGGRPERNIFDSQNCKEKVFKCLLSYNENDRENIYAFDKFFKNKYIPFAVTEFGDVLCLDDEKQVVLYLHESDSFERVCKDVCSFFEGLYN